MELPQESLAHNHRRASYNHIPIRLALHNVSEQCLLPDIREQPFPNTGSRSQRCLWDLISINRHLPLSRNETNPDLPRIRSPGQEKGSAAEGVKTFPAGLDLAAQGR